MVMKAKLKGVKEAKAALKKAREEMKTAVARALYVAGNVVMTDAKQRAPVDFGTLRASGYVTLPDPNSAKPKVEVGFGGAAADYALVQHERTEYRHEVGEAKYLAKAIDGTDVTGIIGEEMDAAGKQIAAGGSVARPAKGPHRTEPE